MDFKRSSVRISPKDFNDYDVSCDVEGKNLQGFLGNISEGGACILIESEKPEEELLTVGEPTSGIITQKINGQQLPFSGKVAWSSVSPFKGTPAVAFGVQFSESIQLPHQLMVLSMSVEE
jgi:hypothetical protein